MMNELHAISQNIGVLSSAMPVSQLQYDKIRLLTVLDYPVSINAVEAV